MLHNSVQRAGIFPSAGDIKPRAFHLTQREWRERSSKAFREHTKGMAKPAHVIADQVDCSPKTAQAWLDGDATPAGVLNLRALNRIPAYAAAQQELTEMEADLHPQVQAKIMELHNLMVALAGGVRA